MSGTARRTDERLVIPDLVLFVNGIPLVVMEAKSPSLLDVWKSQAVRQLRRYQEAGPEWQGRGAPELFHYNLLCVAHCGAAAVYSTLNAPENAYFEWKWLGSYTEDEVRQKLGVEPQGQAQLIVGLLAPATLLDILRDYVVYEPERGRLVKKLPRYQQYRAVRAALARILSGNRPTERGGVVWHTQGSGKSLTMLWLATKIRREPRLSNATIAVVTDRTQLDRQIAGTFERCGFPGPERMDRSRPEPEERRARRRRERPGQRDPLDLQTVLKQGGSRTVMTTIQKFEEALTTPDGPLDLLNPSDNVIIMVDEAHRSQYGDLGALMSKALPNATLIGFTGTPIEKGYGRSTKRRFGHLIDAYTIPQSVADGATVPIFYEARLPELAIEGPETLDRLFDAMFGEQPEDVRERIRRRYANKGNGGRGGAAHRDSRPGHRRTLQGEGASQRVQGPSGGPQPGRRNALRRQAEGFRAERLPHHNHQSQRRRRVPACPGAGPGNGHQRLRRPRRRAGGAGCGGHAPDRLRRSCGAGALPGQAYCGTTASSRPSPGSIAGSPTARTGWKPRRPTAWWWTTTAFPATWRRPCPTSTGRMYRTVCGNWRKTRGR